MKTVLITGGTGLVGSHLVPKLLNKGYRVKILSRSKQTSNTPHLSYHVWDIKNKTIDPLAVNDIDYLIHLAGAGIADEKWTDSRKKVLVDSRVKSLELLYRVIKEQDKKPLKILSTSGIGYYGAITNEQIYTEEDQPSTDFLSEICIAWEHAALQFKDLNIPVFIPRVGVVLAPNGGALDKMKLPAKFHLGSPLGTGKQYMPWIHIHDLCGIYLQALEDDTMEGVFNAVADEHITNQTLSKTIAQTMGKAHFLPNVPSFVLKVIFGKMASVILEGSRASNKKISSHYTFTFKDLKTALNDVI